MDFGCYGANLVTWLMSGVAPLTVTAVTQQIKPEIYSQVEDEATSIPEYPKAQAIIQASWNWPSLQTKQAGCLRYNYPRGRDSFSRVILYASFSDKLKTGVP